MSILKSKGLVIASFVQSMNLVNGYVDFMNVLKHVTSNGLVVHGFAWLLWFSRLASQM